MSWVPSTYHKVGNKLYVKTLLESDREVADVISAPMDTADQTAWAGGRASATIFLS